MLPFSTLPDTLAIVAVSYAWGVELSNSIPTKQGLPKQSAHDLGRYLVTPLELLGENP
jgi:hypothetical protein